MSRDILDRPAPKPNSRVSYGAEPGQFAELRVPAGRGPHPLAIVLHGGYWRSRYDVEHIGHLSAALTARGFVTWSLEYRRLGEAGGGWPGTFEDVATGADYVGNLVQLLRLDITRIIAVGHSAGGTLALWLGGRERIPPSSPLAMPRPMRLRGVAALAAVCDLHRGWEQQLSGGVVQELLGGIPSDVPDRYAAASPAALLPMGTPQVLVHGEWDDEVPFDQSDQYARTARAAGDAASLVALPQADHYDVIDPRSSAWPTVEASIVDLVR